MIAKPWTCQYFLQHLATKLRIWPSLYDGCCCNQNTLSYIHDGGFKWMQSEKIQANCSQEMFSAPNSIYSIWRARVILYFVNIWLVGLAEKGQLSEEKKKLWHKQVGLWMNILKATFERRGNERLEGLQQGRKKIRNVEFNIRFSSSILVVRSFSRTLYYCLPFLLRDWLWIFLWIQSHFVPNYQHNSNSSFSKLYLS